jgi:hypothetical protein
MKTKIECEDGHSVITLIPETELERGIIKSINAYDAKITVTKPATNADTNAAVAVVVDLGQNLVINLKYTAL